MSHIHNHLFSAGTPLGVYFTGYIPTISSTAYWYEVSFQYAAEEPDCYARNNEIISSVIIIIIIKALGKFSSGIVCFNDLEHKQLISDQEKCTYE